MAYNFFITLHIVSASMTGILALYVSFVLWQRVSEKYHVSAILLGSLVTFDVLSGIILSILSENVTALSICKNLIVYILVFLFLETLLFVRIKNIPAVFPLKLAVSPIAMSLVLMVFAVSYGF